MSNEEQILELRRANPKIKISEIVKIVGCARITVRTYLDPNHIRGKAERRKGYRKRVILEHGGKCKICGYSKYLGALDFHHLDPLTKEDNINGCSTLKQVRNEAAKCLLVCSNCHREIHEDLRIKTKTAGDESPADNYGTEIATPAPC